MNVYLTEVTSECPVTGELKTYRGPNAYGISFADAREYCDRNGMGYCRIVGEIVLEVNADGLTPNWDTEIDYETPKLN